MVKRSQPDFDVRELCLVEAMRIIEQDGVEALNLREIARRIGVSHQAPYKHFPSREHVLAEIVRRTFETFSLYLSAQQPSGNAHDDLHTMGHAYVMYGLQHPLQYRLMFGTPLPNPHNHPAMMESSLHAFTLLKDRLEAYYKQRGHHLPPENITLDALYVWSTLHGLVSLLSAHVMEKLMTPEQVVSEVITHTLNRIGDALSR